MKKKDDQPDYIKIYSDIISKRYPEKLEICKNLLSKKHLDSLDILTLNDKIFGIKNQYSTDNRNHRSYDTTAIFNILNYQKKNNLNNVQVASHFKLSRNTVAKWKKIYKSLA